MPETLPLSEQKSLAVRDVLGAFRQTVTNRQTIGYALAAGGVQASLDGANDAFAVSNVYGVARGLSRMCQGAVGLRLRS